MKQKLKRFTGRIYGCAYNGHDSLLRTGVRHLQPVRRQILRSGTHRPRTLVK